MKFKTKQQQKHHSLAILTQVNHFDCILFLENNIHSAADSALFNEFN